MTTLLLNREFKLPADGFIHAVPLGEYPIVLEEPLNGQREIVQVVDADAVQLMLADYQLRSGEPNFPGILVDYDHFSHDKDKSSCAAGWGEALENRADGIFTKVRWSNSGRASVEGGDYRLVSPVFERESLQPLGGNRFRVGALIRLAVTNDPNMRGMQPISNRRDPVRTPAVNPADNQKTMLKPETIAAVLAALGLSAEATDEQVTQALPNFTAAMNKAKEYETLNNRHNALADTLAEADLTALNITDTEARKAAKPLLIANRDGALVLLKANGQQVRRNPITNRKPAGDPSKTPEGEPDEAAENRRASAISNRARSLRANDTSLSVANAYRLAEQQITDEASAA